MPTRPVVVIGGGISGLTVAYLLAKASVPVHVLEGSGSLGGLGVAEEIDGVSIERFYHCIMPTDDNLLPLVEELGLVDDIDWCTTTMGMVVDGKRFPFNTARDLLAFTPLKLHHRIRFGVVSLLLRRLGRGKDLDNIRTEDWLRGVYGDVVWSRILQPLFGAKFGSAFGDVPALYLYQRLGRDNNVAVRGYPAGGYRSIVDALRQAIEGLGGQIDCGVTVESVRTGDDRTLVTLADGEEIDAESVVSTVPLPTLRYLADTHLAQRLPDVSVEYQGVVNAVFLLNRPLDGHYWAPVIDSGTGFDGVVEMSALTGTARYGGRSLVYVMHYCDRRSPLFAEPESVIAARWSCELAALYPDRVGEDGDMIDDVRVFKAPFVEPIHSPGYGARKPAIEVAGTNVFLATTAQIYPDVTSWNASVGLANTVAGRIVAGRTAVALETRDGLVH
jgi:protoporphyrinogen oxidase